MELKALSFWQPYAWLIVNGHADIDSRHWSPPQKYIGTRIAVHAAKKVITKAGYQEFLAMMKELRIEEFPASPKDFDYGALVGTVEIAGVGRGSKSYWAAPGYYHWRLRAPVAFPPLPTKGRMGWFAVEI